MVALLRDTTERIEELYKKHYGKVYGAVFRIVKDEEKARDVTQDVFVSLYDKIGQFEGRSSILTWLYRVAVNRTLDYIKSERKRETEPIHELAGSNFGGLADADSIYFIDEGENTEEKLMYQDRVQSLRAAMQRLQPHERESLELSLEGLEMKKIGEILGVAEGTVKSRLSRARSSLADLVSV